MTIINFENQVEIEEELSLAIIDPDAYLKVVKIVDTLNGNKIQSSLDTKAKSKEISIGKLIKYSINFIQFESNSSLENEIILSLTYTNNETQTMTISKDYDCIIEIEAISALRPPF